MRQTCPLNVLTAVYITVLSPLYPNQSALQDPVNSCEWSRFISLFSLRTRGLISNQYTSQVHATHIFYSASQVVGKKQLNSQITHASCALQRHYRHRFGSETQQRVEETKTFQKSSILFGNRGYLYEPEKTDLLSERDGRGPVCINEFPALLNPGVLKTFFNSPKINEKKNVPDQKILMTVCPQSKLLHSDTCLTAAVTPNLLFTL